MLAREICCPERLQDLTEPAAGQPTDSHPTGLTKSEFRRELNIPVRCFMLVAAVLLFIAVYCIILNRSNSVKPLFTLYGKRLGLSFGLMTIASRIQEAFHAAVQVLVRTEDTFKLPTVQTSDPFVSLTDTPCREDPAARDTWPLRLRRLRRIRPEEHELGDIVCEETGFVIRSA